MLYDVARRLGARGGDSEPRCLCVAGRGAPHVSYLSRSTLEHVATSDGEDVLRFMRIGGFNTDGVPAAMRPRAAALFRCGVLLGALPFSDAQGAVPPDGVPPESETVWEGGRPMHTGGAPPAPCPVYAAGSETDTTWPSELVGRWADVAEQGFRETTLRGVPHDKLMNHATVMDGVFGECAVVAAGAVRLLGR